MKRYTKCILLFLSAFIINGCNPILVPLKGQYAKSPAEVIANTSIDSAWAQIERLFAMHGLPIKKVDKNTGIITTRKTAFAPLYTFEDEAGQLQEVQAWVVLPKASVRQKQWEPKSVYSRWHIQISETGNNTTSIKVEPTVLCTYYPNWFGRIETQGRSTRKLEELIRSLISTQMK